MAEITNESDALKIGFGEYMGRWYSGLQSSTCAMQSFIDRGFGLSVQYTVGRMIDDVQAMLDSYRKNENTTVNNANSKLPVVLVAVAKDYTTTGGDWLGRQTPVEYVRITDEQDAAVYKYSQSMYDVRVQVAFFAAEEATARALARSFGWFVNQYENRRFNQTYTWGEYELLIPVMIENPDLIFMNSATDQKNMTILSCDLTLKVTVPQLQSPEANSADADGSYHDPQGYKVVSEAVIENQVSLMDTGITEDDQQTGDHGTID